MLRGRPFWPVGESDGPERALIAALLLLGIQDAQRGDDQAAAWLEECGADVAETLELRWQDWRRAGLVTHVKRAGRGLTDAERQRRFYWRRKLARCGDGN